MAVAPSVTSASACIFHDHLILAAVKLANHSNQISNQTNECECVNEVNAMPAINASNPVGCTVHQQGAIWRTPKPEDVASCCFVLFYYVLAFQLKKQS